MKIINKTQQRNITFRKNYVHTMMMDRYKQTANDFNTTCNTSNVS